VTDRALAFLRLVAHDVRWAILQELGRSDLRVDELIARLGQPGDAVSDHLGQLRAQGLVRERRGAPDGREVYYSLDVARFQRALIEAASRVRPGLVGAAAQPPTRKRRPSRVLFLCTHNGARSQMAEGLLRAAAGDRVLVESAGTEATELHPLAVQAMARRDVDIRGQRTRHLDELKGERFDLVVTVCDTVREVCPTFAGTPELVLWSVRDPAREAPEDQPATFEEAAEEIARRVRYLVTVLDERAARFD
jgi:ArsR family transcriptional regulator, arsenate/arsenite/antimonite-responsive transcriptional repressor / arsenate reductase (thioredoxin)